jgi:hypothetical protein
VNATKLFSDVSNLLILLPEDYPDFQADLESITENITTSGGDQPCLRQLRPRGEKVNEKKENSTDNNTNKTKSTYTKSTKKVSTEKRKTTRSNSVENRTSESPKKKESSKVYFFISFSILLSLSFCLLLFIH